MFVLSKLLIYVLIDEKQLDMWVLASSRGSVATSMAMVSSSLMSRRAPTSSQVTSGTVAKPSLLAEGCTLAREAWKSDIRMARLPRRSSDRISVFFRRHNSCCRAATWTEHLTH